MNKAVSKVLASIMLTPLLLTTCFAQYYPTDVVHSEENGIYEVQKTYMLPSDVLPTEEMKESFVLEGYEYTLMDMMKQEIPRFSVQDVVDTVELSTKTNKLEDILPLLPATKEHTTEDGYLGELSLDVASINIEIAGYSSGSKTLTETRTYPNLSSADMSNIPQTVTSGGTTYNYASVNWQTSNDVGIDGHSITNRYTAVVSYTAIQKYSYVSGYIVTADYTGTLNKISQDEVQYVAIFRGAEYVPEVVLPELEQLPTVEGENGADLENLPQVTEKESGTFKWQYIAVPIILFVFPVAAYFGIKAIKNKMDENKGVF